MLRKNTMSFGILRHWIYNVHGKVGNHVCSIGSYSSKRKSLTTALVLNEMSWQN